MPLPATSPPPVPGRSAGVAEYLKRAFLYRWNLLLFLGGVGASILSPWPDAVLPLVAAAEIAYLGALTANAKFRSAVDAQVYQEAKQPQVAAANQTLAEVLGTLPLDSRRRFEQLRARCLEMRSIARGVRGGQGQGSDDMSTPALDRLLWVFLRLQVSEQALTHFLAMTNPDEIKARLNEAEGKLEASKGGDERFIHSLRDAVAAHRVRLENYGRAQQNAEFVRVELDRLEAKIHALTESTVNQQDPNVLSSQIEGVAESMQTTEKAIRELNALTGIVDQIQEPPAILESDLRRVTN